MAVVHGELPAVGVQLAEVALRGGGADVVAEAFHADDHVLGGTAVPVEGDVEGVEQREVDTEVEGLDALPGDVGSHQAGRRERVVTHAAVLPVVRNEAHRRDIERARDGLVADRTPGSAELQVAQHVLGTLHPRFLGHAPAGGERREPLPLQVSRELRGTVVTEVGLEEVAFLIVVVQTAEEAEGRAPGGVTAGGLRTGRQGELRVVDVEQVLALAPDARVLVVHGVQTEHEAEFMGVGDVERVVCGHVPGLAGRGERILVNQVVARGIVLQLELLGHEARRQAVVLIPFVVGHRRAVHVDGGAPGVAGPVADTGIVLLRVVVRVGVVDVDVPVLHRGDRRTGVDAGVALLDGRLVGGLQLIDTRTDVVAVLVLVDQRVGRSPAVEVVPYVRRRRGRRIGPRLGGVGVHHTGVDVHEVVDLRVDAHVRVVALEPVVVRHFHHTALVEVTEADVEVRLALAAGDRDVVGLRRGVLLHVVVVRVVGTDADLAVRGVDIPVTAVHHRVVRADGLAVFLLPGHGGVVARAVDEPERADRGEGAETLGGLHRVVQTVHVGDAARVDEVLERDVARVGDLHGLLLTRAFLRVDQDHAEGCLRTVDGGGGGVLQHGDRLDVVRVDEVQRGDLHVVEQDQRGGGTVVGTDLTADADDGVGTDFGGTDTHVQTRRSALQTAADVRDRTALQLLRSVDRCHGAGQVRLLLRAEAHDHGVLKHQGVIRQDGVDHPAAFDRHLEGLVADAGKLQGAVGRRVDGIATVDARRRAGGCSCHHHVGTYDRLVVLVHHLTGDGHVLSQQGSC